MYIYIWNDEPMHMTLLVKFYPLPSSPVTPWPAKLLQVFDGHLVHPFRRFQVTRGGGSYSNDHTGCVWIFLKTPPLYLFFVWRFDSWKRWKLSYSLKQTWFMSICMGVWKIWFISDFTGWGWLKKGQNTDHWPWWFCGSSIEASMELLYYKYLMLLNVKKPTNIFIPESWTMVWVWQCFQTFLALKKTWPSKMLGFSFATQLPWSRVWQHYAFKATSTSHASCFPKSFCFQRCISTFKANLTKNKHPIKLKSN